MIKKKNSLGGLWNFEIAKFGSDSCLAKTNASSSRMRSEIEDTLSPPTIGVEGCPFYLERAVPVCCVSQSWTHDGNVQSQS